MADTRKTAIITGASRGIGAGLVEAFLKRGYNVVANSRHITNGNPFTASPNLALVDGDIGDRSTAAKIVDTAVSKFGRIDVLINNAGVFISKPFTEYTTEDLDTLVSTTIAGFLYLSQFVVKQMLGQKSGTIINVSTTLVDQPIAGVGAAVQIMLKGALNAVTRALAIEYAKEGIRVNTIAPGVIDTPMHKPEAHEFLRGFHPVNRMCDCVKWLRYSSDACFCQGRKHGLHRQHKLTTGTRSWSVAEEKRAELQRRLDTGELGKLPATPEEKRPTIAQCIEIFLTAKEGEGCSVSTIRKLRRQLRTLEHFLSDRSKFFPHEITAADLIEFRASWTWPSGVTRQKTQQNYRGFLRSCCQENLADLLGALKTIRLSKADVARLEPQPFSEDELDRLLAQVPKTFPDPVKAARVTALIHLMVSTGLAIMDTIQLERESIAGGWLRIRRQKTNRPVEQKLDEGLYRELLSVANGNPNYLFWNGTSRPTSATGRWQEDLRQLMEDAGLWIRGNLSHRFRDTAVDFWIGAGCSVVEVAAMLGDTVPIVGKALPQIAFQSDERAARQGSCEGLVMLLTVAEVALILKCSEDAVVKRFAKMAGVVDMGRGETRDKRRYRVLRIPKPILEKYLSTKAGHLVTVQVPPRPERRRKSDNWQTAAILNLAKAGKQNECRDKATLRKLADRASWLLNAKNVSEPDWPELAALLTDSDQFKDEYEDFE